MNSALERIVHAAENHMMFGAQLARVEFDALLAVEAAARAEMEVVAPPPRGMFPEDDALRNALAHLDLVRQHDP